MWRRLDDLFERMGTTGRLATSLLLVLLFGILDISTGHGVSVLLLYLAPVWVGSWYSGRTVGVLIAWLSVGFWAADTAWERPWRWQDLADSLERGVMLTVIALLIRQLRLTLDRERELARADPLTGLANRRVLFESIERECRAMERRREPLTVVYLDLDRFKEVNDRRGHSEGDRLLCAVAGILRGATRPTDLVARIGGDEFVVLLPRTGRPEAERITARLHEDLAVTAAAHGWPVTISAGVATWSKPCVPVDDVMRFADSLLYQAKAGGRNRAEFRTAGED